MKLQCLYRFFGCLVASNATLAAWVAPVFAEEAPGFCAGAQQLLAQTSLSARVVEHADYDGFVQSKATASPLVVQQYFSRPLPGDPAMATVVSCKMKTAERISAAQPASGDAAPAAGTDQSCDAIHQDMLAAALASIDPAQLAVRREKILVDEEALTLSLRQGRLAGAALDVFEDEPLTSDTAQRFKGLNNLLLTPHIAGVTEESNVRVSSMIAERVLEALSSAK